MSKMYTYTYKIVRIFTERGGNKRKQMNNMTSKERVKNAFAHKQPDKIPLDIGGMSCSQMHVTNVAKLREYYGLKKEPVKTWDVFSMVGLIEDDLKDAMGVDIEFIKPYGGTFGFRDTGGWKEMQYMGLDLLVPDGFVYGDDGRGGLYAYPQGDIEVPPSGHMPANGFYFDNIERQKPIDEDHMNPEDNLEEFQRVSKAELDYYRRETERYRNSKRAVVLEVGGSALGGAGVVPGPGLKDPKGIRTVTGWMMAPLLYPEYTAEVFDRQSDIAIENWKQYYEIIGDAADVIYICGTDFGNQRARMCSAEVFDEYYKPYYSKMNRWLHKNTSWKTLKHTCGAVFDVILQLIESGFDAVNPVQCSAAGMEPRRLKDTYGDRILFWGAGVDTQKTLPFGTAEEVRGQVLERCEVFSDNGGFIFASIHCIQCGTPLENIVAMIDAVHEFNRDH